MNIVLVHNPTDRPQPASGDGRQIPGGDTADVDRDDPVVAAAIDAGLLTVWEQKPSKSKSRS